MNCEFSSNKNINIKDDISESENSDDNSNYKNSFEYNISKQHNRNISLDTIESSAFSSDSEDNNSDSEKKKGKGKRGSTIEAKLKNLKNKKIVKANRPVKVKSEAGHINFINNNNNNNILNIIGEIEENNQDLTFTNFNVITPVIESDNNNNNNRHIIVDNIPNHSSDNKSFNITHNTYNNNKTFSKVSSPPSPTISYRNIKKMRESSSFSSTIGRIFDTVFCCFYLGPIKFLFGQIKNLFQKFLNLFKRSKKAKIGKDKNDKEDMELGDSNEKGDINLNLKTKNENNNKKNSNCCLIIFIIIIILLLLGNVIYLDVVANKQLSQTSSEANNITQVIYSPPGNDTDPISKQFDSKVKSLACMTLLSSPLPKQYPCDFCSHQPIVFNNVSEFCVLKGLWANSNNQTSLEENLRWMSTAQYCDWIGVTCNANLSIIGLEILPPHTPITLLAGIGLLSNLQNLNIVGDGIIPRGTIPDNLLQLGSLVNLRFASTGLTGPIPDTFDKMTSLKHLEFIGNANLSTEIPPSIGLLPSLTTLLIMQQGLTGPIPDFIGQSKTLQANLQSLNLNSNNLTGNIPISLTQLTALQSLSLSLNKLSGDIPDILAQSKFKNTLFSIDLSGNAFQNQIPDSLSNITGLMFLYLQANQLTGKIPESLAKLPKLTDLSLSNNQLSGSIPDIIGSINLARLELKNNTLLTGVVPASVCQRAYTICDLTLTGLTSPVNCAICSLPQPIIPPTTTTAAITTPVPTA